MKTLKLILTLVAVLVLTSCEHKDLCYHHPHTVTLKVRFDWRDAPDANPEGMCVYFYPEDGGTPRRFDFADISGGEISISAGCYNIISYNNDTEATQFDNLDSFTNHRAFTRTGTILEPIMGALARTVNSLKAPGADDQQVAICPDDLWGTSQTNILITGDGQTVTLYPHNLLCRYTLEVRNVTGADQISAVSGSLSGMAPALILASEQLHPLPITIPFLAHTSSHNTINAEFLTFGHHPENTEPHHILLYVWLKNGKKIVLGSDSEKFNVTNQVHSASDPRNVSIIIDQLELSSGDDNDDDNNTFIPTDAGNFEPSVDDWGEVDQTIEL